MAEFDERAVKERLLEMRAQLQGRIAELGEAPERGSGISFGKRIGDGTIEAVSRLTEIGVGRNLESAGERVERALAKLEEGTYGRCDSCGQPIDPRRLHAFPDSSLCVDCARQAPRVPGARR